MWSDSYMGIPFVHRGSTWNGCDCWGLVRLVYEEELGITLPAHDVYIDDSPESRQAAAEEAKAERQNWRRVDIPQPYDVVLLRIEGMPCHAGVVVDGRHFLHITSGSESSLEQLYGTHWRKRIDGFFRYA